MTIKITMPSVFFDYLTWQEGRTGLSVLRRGRCSVALELNDARVKEIRASAKKLFETAEKRAVMEALLAAARRTIVLIDNAEVKRNPEFN